MISSQIVQGSIVLIAIIASLIDIKTAKIPNWLNFGGALLGIIFSCVNFGWQGFLSAILAYVLAVLIMVVLDPKHKIGYGDVKLMACIGTFIGPKMVLVCWFFFAVTFGFSSIFRILLTLNPKTLIQDIYIGLSGKGPFKINFDPEKMNKVLKSKLSLAPFIALSLVLTIFYGNTLVDFFLTPR